MRLCCTVPHLFRIKITLILLEVPPPRAIGLTWSRAASLRTCRRRSRSRAMVLGKPVRDLRDEVRGPLPVYGRAASVGFILGVSGLRRPT